MSLKKIKCPNCSMLNDPEDTFCKDCGHVIEEELQSDSDMFDEDSTIKENESIYKIHRSDSYSLNVRIESNSKELVYKTVESGTSEFIAVMGLTIVGIIVSGVIIGFFFGDTALQYILLGDMVILVYIIIVAWSLLPKITIYSQDSEKLGTIRMIYMINILKMIFQQKWQLQEANGNTLLIVRTSMTRTGKVSLGNENFEFTSVKDSKEDYYGGIKEFRITSKIGNKSFRLLSPKGFYAKNIRKAQAPILFQIVTDNDIPLLPQIGTGLIIVKRYITESSTKQYQGMV